MRTTRPVNAAVRPGTPPPLTRRGVLSMRPGVALMAIAVILVGCGVNAAPPTTAPTAAGSVAPSGSSETTSARPGSTTTGVPTTLATTTTTTTRAPRSPVVLGFGGDTAFTGGLAERYPLGDVAAMLSAPDLTVLNLETVVAEPDVGTPLDKTYVFKSPPSTVSTLREAGVDAVSIANNHTLDYNTAGLLRTVELLDDGGIVNFGGGATADEAYGHDLVEVGDWTVGLVGFTHIECSWVANDPTRWPEAPWACPGFEDRTVEAVSATSAESDVTVVMVHWGVELQHCPEAYQRDLAQRWVEAGADLVIGSHPHLLQGVEQIDGAWIVHSTGNFAFPSAREDRAYSAFFTFDVGDDGIDMHAQPIYITSGRPAPISGESAVGVLNTLATRSMGWTFDFDGTPIPRRAAGECG